MDIRFLRLMVLLPAVTIAVLMPSQKALAQSSRWQDNGLETLFERFESDRSGRSGGRVAQSPLDTRRATEYDGREGDWPEAPQDRAQGVEPSRLELDYQSRLKAMQLPATEPTTEEETVRDPAQSSRMSRDGRTSARARPLLRQFGYESVSSSPQRGTRGTTGAISGDYIMGVDDEVVVSLRGQEDDSIRTRVDREGRIILAGLPPVLALGRPFKEVRAEIEDQVRRSYMQTEAFVSLGQVRSIQVNVFGEAMRPGTYSLTGLDGIIDAIRAAGGITQDGTLRQIVLTRGSRRKVIDLYDVLLGGPQAPTETLAAGDNISIGTLGKTVAVYGQVKRQGIFEFTGNSITVSDAMTFAGAPLRGGNYRFIAVSADGGGDRLIPVQPNGTYVLHDGDMLLVLGNGPAISGQFTVSGHVYVPGVRSLALNATARQLLADQGLFKPQPYLALAAIRRRDPRTLSQYLMAVDLTDILSGHSTFEFQDGDELVIFSRDDVNFLSSPQIQNILHRDRTIERSRQAKNAPSLRRNSGEKDEDLATSDTGRKAIQAATVTSRPRRAPQAEETMDEESKTCRSVQFLANMVERTHATRFRNAAVSLLSEQTPATNDTSTCPDIFEDNPDLLPFLLEQSVLLQGEVRTPGVYPVADKASLGVLVTLSGGLTTDANLDAVEVLRFDPRLVQEQKAMRELISAGGTQLDQVMVSPGDVIRFNPTYTARDDGPVMLTGEFVRPGQYAIRRNEHLSDIIRRAGGLTDAAYPLGAVITRESLKEQEHRYLQRLAYDIQSSAVAAMNAQNFEGGSAGVATLERLLETIETMEPIGRLVAEVDPAVLAAKPEKDILLESGDRIHMPKRPSHVMISGEVLNPGAQTHLSGTTVTQYIRNAGGVSSAAEGSKTFVVLPNGRAEPASISSWSTSDVRIPPGSVIVVPRDVTPFNTRIALRDWLDITYKAALSLATIHLLQDD